MANVAWQTVSGPDQAPFTAAGFTVRVALIDGAIARAFHAHVIRSGNGSKYLGPTVTADTLAAAIALAKAEAGIR